MFSLKQGLRIALIVGGKNDGKYLRITEEEDVDEDHNDEEKLNIVNAIIYGRDENRRSLRSHEIEQLEEAILEDIPPKSEKLKKLYKLAKETLNHKLGKEFHLTDGVLQPIAVEQEDQVQRILLAGAQGSGKSTWISKYIIMYKEAFPENPVYLFSRKDEDKALDDLDITRIMINEDLLEEPIELDELKDSLVIFDDIDTIGDKKLLTCVRKLRDDILETGRSSNIYTISTVHLMMNWKTTRGVLNESSDVILFPKYGSTFQIKRFLKEYQGFDVSQINKFIKLPSRWVMLHRIVPFYVMYESGCYFI